VRKSGQQKLPSHLSEMKASPRDRGEKFAITQPIDPDTGAFVKKRDQSAGFMLIGGKKTCYKDLREEREVPDVRKNIVGKSSSPGAVGATAASGVPANAHLAHLLPARKIPARQERKKSSTEGIWCRKKTFADKVTRSYKMNYYRLSELSGRGPEGTGGGLWEGGIQNSVAAPRPLPRPVLPIRKHSAGEGLSQKKAHREKIGLPNHPLKEMKNSPQTAKASRGLRIGTRIEDLLPKETAPQSRTKSAAPKRQNPIAKCEPSRTASEKRLAPPSKKNQERRAICVFGASQLGEEKENSSCQPSKKKKSR